MSTFWTWGVRNPALAASLLGFAAGVSGVTGWSLGLVAGVVGIVVADSAHHLAQRSGARKRRAKMALEAERAARVLREGYPDYEGKRNRTAA